MHKLLEKEIQLVGKENIVLWGSRQGCAVALSTLLTWDGEPFAALVGMSGWLPFNNWVWDFANGDDSDLHRDEWFDPDTYWPKEHEDDEDFDWPTKAIKYFRFELYLEEKKGEAFKHIPVFLGQSRKDKITELGREAKKCLEIIGAKVQMIEYESLSSVHGYSREMLDDAFDFLRDKLGGKSDV
jgi:predicted esterase